MAKRILVIGLGRFGAAVAEALAQQGCEVVAVDTNMRNIDAIKNKVTYALELDASDPTALRSIDAHTCTVAIVAIGENFEGAVLSAAALRELGVGMIIARAMTPRHARILVAAGAHRVIEIESEMGRALGRELAGGSELGVMVAQVALGQQPPGAQPPPGYTPSR